MAFCKNCGARLDDDSRFCLNCGAAAEPEETRTLRCVQCGRPITEDAAFCPFCGHPRSAQTAPIPSEPRTVDRPQTAQPRIRPEPMPAVTQAVPQAVTQTVAQAVAQAVPQAVTQTVAQAVAQAVPQAVTQAVDVTAKELSFELPGFAGASTALEQAIPIAGPIRTAFGGIKTLFTNIGRVGGSKKALISAILAFAAWTAIGLWNRSGFGNDLSQTLSTILYAQGGTKGTAAQIAGGILGKGVVMTAVLSLFSGGFIGTFKGIGKLFGRGLAFGTLTAGLGTALLFHQLLAGFTGLYGTAVAVSGAVLSLQALSGRFGFLRSMAVSLTSRKVDKVRSENPVGMKSFLTGLTLGMALSGALSVLLPLPWWIGGILVVIGILIQAVLGRKEAKV